MTSQTAPDRRAIIASGKSPREAYEDLLSECPDLRDNWVHGVRIASTRAEIDRIQHEIGMRYEGRKWPRSWVEVGAQYADPYVAMLRDAVVFPDGSAGIHRRLIAYAQEPSGIAVLPLFEGKLVLLRHFRHPLRTWSLEIPRGAREPGGRPVDAVRREFREEAGGEIGEIKRLGIISGSGGIAAMLIELFAADVVSLGETALCEGINTVRLVTAREFEQLVVDSQIIDAFTV